MAMRLIDQAALIEDIEAAEKNAGMGAVVAGTLKRYVKRQPTVDVVRCRDCRWRGSEQCAMFYRCDCGEQHTWETDGDFCSYGERKEE